MLRCARSPRTPDESIAARELRPARPVTAANMGPRTMEHLGSQLTAAEVTLTDDVLDGVDEIVPPGVTINDADNGWTQPALAPDARRR